MQDLPSFSPLPISSCLMMMGMTLTLHLSGTSVTLLDRRVAIFWDFQVEAFHSGRMKGRIRDKKDKMSNVSVRVGLSLSSISPGTKRERERGRSRRFERSFKDNKHSFPRCLLFVSVMFCCVLGFVVSQYIFQALSLFSSFSDSQKASFVVKNNIFTHNKLSIHLSLFSSFWVVFRLSSSLSIPTHSISLKSEVLVFVSIGIEMIFACLTKNGFSLLS